MEKQLDFKKLEVLVKKVIKKGKKFNVVDRLYYYSIKKNEIKNRILQQSKSENDFNELSALLLVDFNIIEHELTFKIIEIFCLNNLKIFCKKEKSLLLSNPSLLGISPQLFRSNINEWSNYMINDISKWDYINIYEIENIILNSLHDSLYRQDLKLFVLKDLNGNIIESTPEGLFSLLVDDIFELIDSNDINQINLNSNLEMDNRIILHKYTTMDIVNGLIGSFKAPTNLTNEEKKEVRKFVSKLFKNKNGKQLKFDEVINETFIYKNVEHFITILNSTNIFKLKNWSKISVCKLIAQINPIQFNLNTIKNY